jgi:hypothetical protein
MATKKKRKRPYTPPAPRAAGAASIAEGTEKAAPVSAPPARRQNKEEARRARERAIRQYRRRAALRRVVTLLVVLAVAAAAFYFLTRVGKPKLSKETAAAATAAKCSGLTEQPDRGRSHDPPYTYTDHPATSGSHDPNPAAAGVYSEALPEEQVVHAMEHGYVVVYYRATGDGAIADNVLTAIENAAEPEAQVIVAPYEQLPDGVTVAFAAWRYDLTCPSGMTPTQATDLTNGWIKDLRDAGTAPEKQID